MRRDSFVKLILLFLLLQSVRRLMSLGSDVVNAFDLAARAFPVLDLDQSGTFITLVSLFYCFLHVGSDTDIYPSFNDLIYNQVSSICDIEFSSIRMHFAMSIFYFCTE